MRIKLKKNILKVLNFTYFFRSETTSDAQKQSALQYEILSC